MTLDELDREIALLRGWTPEPRGTDEIWSCAPDSLAWRDDVGCQRCDVPTCLPPFSRSWALAGPLLEEMNGCVGADIDDDGVRATVDGWIACDDGVVGMWGIGEGAYEAKHVGRGATPTEAICRAWLAWKRARVES